MEFRHDKDQPTNRERGWRNPIITRWGLGYVWTLPVTLASVDHAPAAGADEFRFIPHERKP